jgi:hypothetical protein
MRNSEDTTERRFRDEFMGLGAGRKSLASLRQGLARKVAKKTREGARRAA